MNILYVFADNPVEYNSSHWRCTVPIRAINHHGENEARSCYIRNWNEGSPKAIADSEWADVIVVQRLLFGSTIIAMERWKGRGKTIIGEVDDAYNLMPKNLAAYRLWHEGIMPMRFPDGKERIVKTAVLPKDQLVWGMKLTHGITTPSTKLCQDWSEYHPHVHYLPNYIDGDVYRPLRNNKAVNKDRIIIGWGGSGSHIDSWKKSHIVEALRKIMDKNENVYVAIGAAQAGSKSIADMIKAQERVIRHPQVHADQWPGVLATFDIGLIPLASEYDKRRSWLKSLEYTFMGIPWIGTAGPPTEELSAFGRTVTNSVSSWERALRDYIDNLEQYKDEAQRNIEVAEEFAIRKNVHKIIETYEEIVSYTRKESKS